VHTEPNAELMMQKQIDTFFGQ